MEIFRELKEYTNLEEETGLPRDFPGRQIAALYQEGTSSHPSSVMGI